MFGSGKFQSDRHKSVFRVYAKIYVFISICYTIFGFDAHITYVKQCLSYIYILVQINFYMRVFSSNPVPTPRLTSGSHPKDQQIALQPPKGMEQELRQGSLWVDCPAVAGSLAMGSPSQSLGYCVQWVSQWYLGQQPHQHPHHCHHRSHNIRVVPHPRRHQGPHQPKRHPYEPWTTCACEKHLYTTVVTGVPVWLGIGYIYIYDYIHGYTCMFMLSIYIYIWIICVCAYECISLYICRSTMVYICTVFKLQWLKDWADAYRC